MAAGIETSQASDAPERNGVYLLTLPRSASNLFQRMMAAQPGYQNSAYKTFWAGVDALRVVDKKSSWSDWSEEDRQAMLDKFRAGFEGLQDDIADAKKHGKQVFIKEHAMFLYSPEQIVAFALGGDAVEPLQLQLRDAPASTHTNPSSLPDQLLLSMQPIFQIRHPALAFPSLVRAHLDIMGKHSIRSPRTATWMSLKYSRDLYDWYCANASTLPPKVIDADEIMANPAAVRQLCLDTGMDPDAVQYQWDVRKLPDRPSIARMAARIFASTGIIEGLDGRGLDVDAEKFKWKAEFGEEEGENLARMVDDAMPDYEHLLRGSTYRK